MPNKIRYVENCPQQSLFTLNGNFNYSIGEIKNYRDSIVKRVKNHLEENDFVFELKSILSQECKVIKNIMRLIFESQQMANKVSYTTLHFSNIKVMDVVNRLLSSRLFTNLLTVISVNSSPQKCIEIGSSLVDNLPCYLSCTSNVIKFDLSTILGSSDVNVVSPSGVKVHDCYFSDAPTKEPETLIKFEPEMSCKPLKRNNLERDDKSSSPLPKKVKLNDINNNSTGNNKNSNKFERHSRKCKERQGGFKRNGGHEIFNSSRNAKKRARPEYYEERSAKIPRTDIRSPIRVRYGSKDIHEVRDNRNPNWNRLKVRNMEEALDLIKSEWDVLFLSNPHINLSHCLINKQFYPIEKCNRGNENLVSYLSVYDSKINELDRSLREVEEELDGLNHYVLTLGKNTGEYYSTHRKIDQKRNERNFLNCQYGATCDARMEIKDLYKFYERGLSRVVMVPEVNHHILNYYQEFYKH